MSAATITPPIACPPWCTVTEHHYEDGDDVWPVLGHEALYECDAAYVLLFVEDEISPSGAVRSGPQVHVEIDAKIGPYLSPQQAVRLMRALSEATTAAVAAVASVPADVAVPV
ncbi:MAG: hypothetical protein ACR2FG_15375 [Marmoricola sp.]